jgi:sugar phosphate isomerase/epimerase
MNKIGVFTACLRRDDPSDAMAAVRSLGMSVIQVGRLEDQWYSADGARRYRGLLRRSGVTASACVVVHAGESYDDLASVARTVGYLPATTCEERVQHSLAVADFAAGIGAPMVTTHVGFIPADSQHEDYTRILSAVGRIGEHCRGLGLTFALETGQETSGEFVAFIDRVGLDNVRVNFDGANFTVYGEDDPLSVVSVLRDLIVGVHVKDGLPPAGDGRLGRQVLLGEGESEPCAWVKAIVEGGYTGPLVLELYAGIDPLAAHREGKAYLEECLSSVQ